MKQSNPFRIIFYRSHLQLPIVQWLVIAALFCNIALWVTTALMIRPSLEVVKLQYHVIFGTSLFAPWWGVYLLPTVGLLFMMFDHILAVMMYRHRQRIAAYTIFLGGLFVQLCLLIALVGIILNNR